MPIEPIFYHLLKEILCKTSTFVFKLKIMNWIILIIAGLFEVAFASCLGKVKETSGTEMVWWFVGFLTALTISMLLLIKATQTLPIGTAYAVWTGIGAVGTVLMGIFVFKDPASFWRIFFIITLIGSIIGLKAVSH
jgi:quaternary ammonium compound-resistance protein SugE